MAMNYKGMRVFDGDTLQYGIIHKQQPTGEKNRIDLLIGFEGESREWYRNIPEDLIKVLQQIRRSGRIRAIIVLPKGENGRSRGFDDLKLFVNERIDDWKSTVEEMDLLRNAEKLDKDLLTGDIKGTFKNMEEIRTLAQRKTTESYERDHTIELPE